MAIETKVPNSTRKALFCLILGTIPLVLDASGALGPAWPRGALPAGMSRLALGFAPWLLVFAAPVGRRASAHGLLLGLPAWGLAAASDHAAGVSGGSLLFGGCAALLMLIGLGGLGRQAAGPRGQRLRLGLWMLLVIAPVVLALVRGFVGGGHGSGAPLAPDQAPAWLGWSPLGWCLAWVAENPGLEPRASLAPYGALIVALAVGIAPGFFTEHEESEGHDPEQPGPGQAAA